MNLPKIKRMRDRKYLDSYRDSACFLCQNTEGVCGCHIRTGSGAGMGIKPSDYLSINLCGRCHAAQHATNETDFWKSHGYTVKEIKRIAKARYSTWLKDGK